MRTSTTLPADLDRRLTTLGETLARVSPEIEFAYLFGSAATGRLTPRSDVDLAIHVTKEADGQALRLAALVAATKHLGTDAVEVVLLNTAPVALAGRVLTSRQVLLDRAPFARHLYESVTARLFQDFRIHEHRLLAARYAVVDRDLILRKLSAVETYHARLDPSIVVKALREDWRDLESFRVVVLRMLDS